MPNTRIAGFGAELRVTGAEPGVLEFTSLVEKDNSPDRSKILL